MGRQLITYYTRVNACEPRERVYRGWKDAKGDAHYLVQPLGWYVVYEGSYEAMYVGEDEPRGMKPGQRVRVTIEPVAEPVEIDGTP